MVTILVTGTPRETGTMIEVITENLETKVCSQMPKYPLEVSSAAGGYWKDGKLAICGGSDPPERFSKCHLLENGEWNEIESLQTECNEIADILLLVRKVSRVAAVSSTLLDVQPTELVKW